MVFNFERLDILLDSIGHPSKKLLSLEISQSLHYQLWASRYITGFIRRSELNVIVVWFCSKFLFWISSVSIYYGTQLDVREKSYYRLNLLRASVFNFERLDILRNTIRRTRKSYYLLNLLRASVFNFECLDILRDSFRHPSKQLLSLEFTQSFSYQLRASQYITRLNRTSE